MHKCNHNVISTIPVSIFNHVFSRRYLSKIMEYLTYITLFKAGDSSEASNYRGICVGNAIGKLFDKCINTRIGDYYQNKIIPDNGMGIRRKIQTEHAMHTLSTINSK